MRHLVTVLSILISLTTFCQSEYYGHGTVILAAIGSDGIILVGDARMILTTDTAQFDITKPARPVPKAYIDYQQKVFTFKNFAIGMSGYSEAGKWNLGGLLKEMRKTEETISGPLSLLNTLLDYFSYYAGEQYLIIRDWNSYLSIGYEENKATIWFDDHRRFYRQVDTGWQSNYKHFIKFDYSPKYNCDRLAKNAELAYKNFIEDHKVQGLFKGPLTVIKVTKNQPAKIIKNDFLKTSFLTVCDYLDDYLNNKSNRVFVDKSIKDDFTEKSKSKRARLCN